MRYNFLMKTRNYQTILYKYTVLAAIGTILLSGCASTPSAPSAEPVPSIAESIPAAEEATQETSEEPVEEDYVRTIDDAGEDDGSAPLDIEITEGIAGEDYPIPKIDAAKTEAAVSSKDSTDPLQNITNVLQVSDDIIAVIDIPCLDLVYPIYWIEYDNQYYLDHDGTGADSLYGCIVADGWNLPDFTDCDTIIYGHNMADYSMFGSLKKMLNNPQMVDKDPYIYIYQEDSVKRYQIYAFNVTTEEDAAYELPELNYPKENDPRALPSDQVVDEYGTTAEKAAELAAKENEKSSESATEGTTEDLSVGDLMQTYAPNEAQKLYNSWYDQFVANAQNDSQYFEHYTEGIDAPDFSKRPRNLMLATCYGAAHSTTRFLVHAVLDAEYKR